MSLPLDQLALLMVAAVVGVPLMGVLHELAHVLALWPVADRIVIDPGQQVVRAEVADDPWRQRIADVAGVAPVAIGVVSVLALLAAGVALPPPTSATGLFAWGLWIAFSVTGGVSDYLPAVSRERGARADD
jgi:hypothetical protein